MKRHRWEGRHRTWGSWESVCADCGAKKSERFCYDRRWIEYVLPDGTLSENKAPPCQPKPVEVR